MFLFPLGLSLQCSLKASVLSICIDFSKNSPELLAAARVQISGVTCRLFMEGDANMSIFKMAVWYLLLSHCMCPVIFDLNGFNSVLTACCQWTERRASLFQGSSIIHYNQNSSATPGNYWLQATSHMAGSRKNTHMHAAVWPCVMSGIRNTFRH